MDRGQCPPVVEIAGELLRQGRYLKIKARGSSMVPFLLDGDVVHVTAAEGGGIGVGDVICYETSPGRLFFHRVVRRDGDGFVTKGDALAFTDLVSRGQVLGKVVAVERRGRLRRLDTGVARWRNRLIVLLSPFLLRLLPLAIWVRRIWRTAGGR